MEKNFLDDREKVRELFVRIADIKQRQKDLEDEKRKLEAIAFAYCKRISQDTIRVTGVGTFSRIVSTYYSYSPQVAAKEEEVKELKQKEREEGLAKIKSVTAQLRFTQTKGE